MRGTTFAVEIESRMVDEAPTAGLSIAEHFRRRLFMLSGTMLVVCLWPNTPATAQTINDTSATSGNTGTIEEVVVTATRRSEVITTVPESISAFTSDKMESLDAHSFADLVRFTPGVTFDPDSKNISIRGVNSSAGAGTTGLYVDDTPIQMRSLGFNANNSLPSLFDLDHVEVLRGPQGTLFGAGSEGGTVRYITPQPSLSEYSVYAKTELSETAGGDPSFEAGAAVGGPIIADQLGFRISVWGRHDGGWIDRVDFTNGNRTQANANGTDWRVVRAEATYEPLSTLTITPSLLFQNRNQHDADQYWVARSVPSEGIYRTGTPEHLAEADRYYLPALKIDYDSGNVEVISNASYFDRHDLVNGYSGTLYNLSYLQQLLAGFTDPAGNMCTSGLCGIYSAQHSLDPALQPPPLLTSLGPNLDGFGPYKAVALITNNQRNFTQEFRVQSEDANAPLVWIVGIFYSQNTQQSVEELDDPQFGALTQFLFGETLQQAWGEDLLASHISYINSTIAHDRQIAAFANATYTVSDGLKLLAGARIARTHFDFRNYSDGPQNYGFESGAGMKDETPFTPMAGVTYDLSPGDLAYFTFSEGYRMGGANAPVPLPSCTADLAKLGVSTLPGDYNSDKVANFEIGLKAVSGDQRLQVSTSAFHLNWNNIQQENYLSSCGFQYTTNLGSARSNGFDVEANWLLLDSLEIDLTAGYVDARYTKDSFAGPLSAAPIVARGDTLPGSPWTVSLGGQYTFELLGRASHVLLNYEFAGRNSSLSPQRDPNTTQFDAGLTEDPATNLLSVRAETSIANFNIAVFADNLLNSHPQLGLNHQDQYTLLYEAATLRPRTAGLTVTYRD